jgi:MFS family permease
VSVGRRLASFLGLRRNVVLLLVALSTIGLGEELWLRFVPKYLEVLGAGAWVIGVYDGLRTLLGALYAYPGGAATDRWGHRRALVAFTLFSLSGYALMFLIPHWRAVLAATFLFSAWSFFSLPATFSLVAATLSRDQHAMGIGVQSLVKRIPILIGPLLGGILVDSLGVASGVRAGLLTGLALGTVALIVQSRIDEAPAPAEGAGHFAAVVRDFSPELRRLLLSDILIRFCERIPYAWLVIYAMTTVGVSGQTFGWLTTVEVATAMACYVPVARLADRHGREPFVLATFGFFTAFPLVLLFSASPAMLFVAFVVRGLKEFGEPARKALIVGLAPEAFRGRTVGAYYLIRDLVVAPGALLGAALWAISPQANFLGAFLIGAGGTLLYAWTLRRRRRRAIPQSTRPGAATERIAPRRAGQ